MVGSNFIKEADMRKRSWERPASFGLRAMSAALVAAGCLTLGSGAVWAAPARYALVPESTSVRFEGRSTLHDFGGDARSVEGAIVWDEAAGKVGEGVIRIRIEDIKTGMVKRDQAMRKMFDTGRFPLIEFRPASIERLGAADGGAVRYRLNGTLAMHGMEKPLAFEAAARTSPDGTLEVEGDTHVSIDWFGLKPPSPLGLVRVLPDVHIRFKSVWRSPQ